MTQRSAILITALFGILVYGWRYREEIQFMFEYLSDSLRED